MCSGGEAVVVVEMPIKLEEVEMVVVAAVARSPLEA